MSVTRRTKSVMELRCLSFRDERVMLKVEDSSMDKLCVTVSRLQQVVVDLHDLRQ